MTPDEAVVSVLTYLESECEPLRDRRGRMSVIGRRDRISSALRRTIACVEDRRYGGVRQTG